MPQDAPQATAIVGDRANWGMLALGWLIYLSFGIGVASLVPLVSVLRSELDLSYTQMGTLLGAWQLIFMAAAAPAGWMIDRYGPKRVLVAAAFIVAISLTLRGFAAGYPMLLFTVAFFGLGGPVTAVGLAKLIADWFTGATRGLASGIYITGASVGIALPLALTHPVILPLTGGWREAHFLYGAIAFAIAIAWLVLGRDSPQSKFDRMRSDGASEKGSYRQVITQPAVWFVIIVGFAGFLANHGVRNWLPGMLELAGVSPTGAGLLGALPALTGIFGSIIILRLATRRAGARRPAILLLLIANALAILAIILTEGWLLVLAIAIEGFVAAALTPLMLNTLMEMPSVGAKNTGAAAGLYFTVGELGGTLGPVLMGIVADLTGSFAAGMVMVAAFIFSMIIPALKIRV